MDNIVNEYRIDHIEYRELRLQMCFSQSQLATVLGVSRSTIARREEGPDPVSFEEGYAIRRLIEIVCPDGEEASHHWEPCELEEIVVRAS